MFFVNLKGGALWILYHLLTYAGRDRIFCGRRGLCGAVLGGEKEFFQKATSSLDVCVLH